MRKMFVLFMLVAFLAAACAKAPGAPAAAPSGIGPQAAPATTAQEQETQAKCTFDEEGTGAKAVLGKDLAAYPPFVQGVSGGDCATFGIVLGNYHSNLAQDVYAELKFTRAYDANNNNPGADEVYMLNWIQSNFPQSYSLGPNKFVVFPVNIVVGDKISTTQDTKPATYEFELITYTYKGSFKKEYQPPFRLTVKTK